MNFESMQQMFQPNAMVFKNADKKDYKSIAIQMLIHAFAGGDPNKMLDIVETLETLMVSTVGDEHIGYCGKENIVVQWAEKDLIKQKEVNFNKDCYWDNLTLFSDTVLWGKYGKDLDVSLSAIRDLAKFKWKLLWKLHENQTVEEVIGVIGVPRKQRESISIEENKDIPQSNEPTEENEE